ncbi:MAG: FtsW/RodA/SpoVE family cell cycle protein [Lachnospiraceae bacterium]|nr:FtsW/RodA/SpoVE family cell cycle protein [Lachnospiraceae bacterium]
MAGKFGYLNETKFRARDINFRLIVYVLLLSTIGVFVVHSATASEVTRTIVSTTVKQVIGVGMGLVAMIILAFIDYRKIVKYSWILLLISIGSLIYVRFFTRAIYGAHRWIYVPFFGTIQPSEFSKPALLVFLAFVLYKIHEKIDKVYVLILYFLLCAPVLVLVLMEPDLSTSIVLVLMIITLLFLADISWKWIIGVIIALIPLVALFFIAVYQEGQPLLWKIFEEHQVLRINAFFFPENYPGQTYQQNNSVMAIGSGGIFGKGLMTSSLESVKNGQFLSEEQCDFIFAVVGEELGFIGAAVIILLIGLIVFECLHMAEKCQDIVGRVIAGGVGCMIGFQSFINIAVSLLLIPNTGIPLPFVSAGMSSLLSSFILLGLALSVGLRGRLKKRVFY